MERVTGIRRTAGQRRKRVCARAAVIGCLAAALTFGVAGTATLSSATAARLTTIEVGGVASESYLPFYVAMAKGYFKQFGIQMSIVSISNELPLVSDSVQLQLSGFETAVINAAAGIPTPIVAMMQQHAANSLWLRAGISDPGGYPADVNNLKQLLGNDFTVGSVNLQSGSAPVIEAPLGIAGLTFGKDYTVDNLGTGANILAALVANRVDVGSLFPPFDAEAAADGMTPLVQEATGVGPAGLSKLYGVVVVGNPSWVASHRTLAKEVNKAVDEGDRYVADYAAHKVQLLNIAAQYTGVPASIVGKDLKTLSLIAGGDVSCQRVLVHATTDKTYGVVTKIPTCAQIVNESVFARGTASTK